MNKLLSFLFCLLTSLVCFGQSAKELNKKSKELLTKKEFAKAVPLLQKAATAGNAEAQYNYGLCYQQGLGGLKENDKIANEWFFKSAKQGWADAQLMIAGNYATGLGIQKDEKQAFYWSMKCARQKNVECMFNVISCYFGGIGTKQNIDSVVFWATRIGSLPDRDNARESTMITSSRKNLAMLYHDGDKIKKDVRKSYMWFLIYNENKKVFTALEQKNNLDVIKDLERQLTTADRAKIKLEAESQIGRKLKNFGNLHNADDK